MSTDFSDRMAKFSYRNLPPPAKTTSKHKYTPGKLDARPGEYWLVSQNGELDWPVVICDKDIVHRYFRGPRSENARVSDGTGPDVFQYGGYLNGQFCFPVLYLGTLEL